MFDVDFCEKINEKIKNEIDAFFKNSSIESDNREDFDDIIVFDIIFAQNINFFDIVKKIANDVANKINSIKVNKIMKNLENEISDEIKDCFENETI